MEYDATPGMLLGAEASGQTDTAHENEPDSSSLEVLLGCPVESRLGQQQAAKPESVCVTFARKSRPHDFYKESVA